MYDEDDTDDEIAQFGIADIRGANVENEADWQALMDLIDEHLTLRDMLFHHVTLGDA